MVCFSVWWTCLGSANALALSLEANACSHSSGVIVNQADSIALSSSREKT